MIYTTAWERLAEIITQHKETARLEERQEKERTRRLTTPACYRSEMRRAPAASWSAPGAIEKTLFGVPAAAHTISYCSRCCCILIGETGGYQRCSHWQR
jgi:hypothetical protein